MRRRKNILSLIFIMICLLASSLTVFAKNEAVTISDAEATTSSVTVSGSTKALAVMVQVRDADDNILKMESFGTQSGEFTGKIDDLTLTKGVEYTVYVADYEGGDWTTKVVKVPDSEEDTTEATTEATTQATTEATKEANVTTNKKSGPGTGDVVPVVLIVIISVVSFAGIIIAVKLKRKYR